MALNERSQSPYVLLQNFEEGDTLTVQIGPSEAGNILLSLTESISNVPSLYDAIGRLFAQHHCRPWYIEIKQFGGPESSAALHYKSILSRRHIPIQAADGIVLALKFDVPIFLTPEAIITGTIHNPLKGLSPQEAEQFLYISA